MEPLYDYLGLFLSALATALALFGGPWDKEKNGLLKFTPVGWIAAPLAVLGAIVGGCQIHGQHLQLKADKKAQAAVAMSALRMEMIGLLRTEAALRGLVEPIYSLQRKYFRVGGNRSGPQRFEFNLRPWFENALEDTMDVVPLNERGHYGRAGNRTWGDHILTSTTEFRADADRITTMYGQFLPQSIIVLLDEIRSGPYVSAVVEPERLKEAEMVGDVVNGYHVRTLAERVMELADSLNANYVDTILSWEDAAYYRSYHLMDSYSRDKAREEAHGQQ